MLSRHACQHEASHKHVPCEGGKTRKSAYKTRKSTYCPSEMCESIIAQVAQLFPMKYYHAVPTMPVVPHMSQSHVRNEVPPEEFPRVSLSIMNGWTKVIGSTIRMPWKKPGKRQTAWWKPELGSMTKAFEDHSLKSRQGHQVGKLLLDVCWQVFLGTITRQVESQNLLSRWHEVRDAFSKRAGCQEIKVILTTFSGLNWDLAYGMKRGHKSTQSDITKAYIQSDLKALVDTYVELHTELVQSHLKHNHRPCAR